MRFAYTSLENLGGKVIPQLVIYLFILCIEILSHKLRSDEDVKGFGFNACVNDDSHGVNVLKHLLEIYADDLTIFMEPCSQNLRIIVNILKNFYKLSGLKISASKTKAVWFGSKHDTDEQLCPDLGLKWVKLSLCWGQFHNNLENINKNFSDKVDKMEKLLSNWSYT